MRYEGYLSGNVHLFPAVKETVEYSDSMSFFGARYSLDRKMSVIGFLLFHSVVFFFLSKQLFVLVFDKNVPKSQLNARSLARLLTYELVH